MLIYDDTFHWEGFGGKLKLGSGKCHLRIYDLNKGDSKDIAHLKSIVVVASDLPDSKMTVRSCSSHIISTVVQQFNFSPHRIQFVEYYPQKFYGEGNQKVIPETFEAIEFTWKGNKALHPRINPLRPPLLDLLKKRLHAETS